MTSRTVSERASRSSIVSGFGAERIAAERELRDRGIPLAITEHVESLRAFGHSDAALIVVEASTGSAVVASIAATPSRALPGHRWLRAKRVGGSDDAAADEMLLRRIAEYGRSDYRCLGLTIELFDRDRTRRSRLAAAVEALGFERVASPRSYPTTLALDLSPSTDELLKAVDGDTRRSIRAPTKHRMELRSLDDDRFAGRIETMVAQAFARTGARPPQLPWRSIIGMSTREPSLSRVSAVFDPNVDGPESLVSFAWGVKRGSCVSYEAGAVAHRKDLGSTSLGYASVWDLVLWAKQVTASWFDFGGVTPGNRPTPDDPVGGISAFKRSFRGSAVEVGEEWVLRPHPVRAAIADLLAATARRVLMKARGSS